MEAWGLRLFHDHDDAAFDRDLDLMQGFVEDTQYMASVKQRLAQEDQAQAALKAKGLLEQGNLRRRALPPLRREWVERIFAVLDAKGRGYIMISDFGCVIEAYDGVGRRNARYAFHERLLV